MAVGQLYRGFVVDHVGGYPVAGGGDFHRHGDRYLGKVVAWWEDGRGLARLASPVGTSAGSATEGGQLPFVFYTGRVPEGEASGSGDQSSGARDAARRKPRLLPRMPGLPPLRFATRMDAAE